MRTPVLCDGSLEHMLSSLQCRKIKRGGKIFDQVVDVLQAYREPYEVFRNSRLRPERRIHGGVRHALRVVDERFDASERLRKGKYPDGAQDVMHLREPSFNIKGYHPAKTGLLTPRKLMVGMGLKSRIIHATYPGMADEKTSHAVGI